MTINNPPDQPSVEQITTKNNISYTSHDHHPLTGTPFPENNTAIPTTPTTLTTLTTLASDPAANLASSPAIPATPTTLATLTTLATGDHSAANLASSPAIPATPTTLATLATLATGDHSDSNFPLRLTTLEHTTLPSIVTLRATKGLSRWAERCFAALSMTALPLTTALWQSSPTGVTSPFTLP